MRKAIILILVLCFSIVSYAYEQNALKTGLTEEYRPGNMDRSISPVKSQNDTVLNNETEKPSELELYELDECTAYGCFLFGGDFSRENLPIFNPSYAISIGDKVNIKTWGSLDLDIIQKVDAQGNVFVPTVGPIHVQGVTNERLNTIINAKIKDIYTGNIGVYAGLMEAQPIMVYVSGNVNKPGAYAGTSSNSLMYFLDRARGINQQAGSFLDIKLIRNNKTIQNFNMYDFILEGKTPSAQFIDGDMIYVAPRMNSVKVDGLVVNNYEFEFNNSEVSASELLEMAKVDPKATHIRVTRNSLETRDVEYFSIKNLSDVMIYDGDEVVVLSDKQDGTITVRIEGEHLGEREVVLPYGSRLSEVLEKIQFAETSDKSAVQLFRQSVAEMQKEQLLQSLNKVEMSVLKARSATVDEAKLRIDEANLITQWVEKAKQVEMKGQIVLGNSSYYGVILESGDRIYVPNDNALVHVYGEVLFPVTTVYSNNLKIKDLISKAGGLSDDNADNRIIVESRSGKVTRADIDTKLAKGDKVLVLPEVDVKSFQLAKDISQIMYQIAVSAGVLLAL